MHGTVRPALRPGSRSGQCFPRVQSAAALCPPFFPARLPVERAGIDPAPEYLGRMGVKIDNLQHSPGRRLMSAEEASWNTWLRSDAAETNSISYYTKG